MAGLLCGLPPTSSISITWNQVLSSFQTRWIRGLERLSYHDLPAVERSPEGCPLINCDPVAVLVKVVKTEGVL